MLMITSKLKNQIQIIFLLLLGFASWAVYLPLNKQIGVIHSTHTPLDDHIPFIAIFVIPYLLYIPFLWGVIIWRAIKMDHFGRIIATFITINLISAIFYIFYQTQMIRPFLDNKTGFYLDLVRYVYQLDKPYNCFPSMHVSGSVFAAFVLWRYSPKLKWYGVVSAVLICASTVLIKQHYFLDVIGGILLVYLGVFIVEKFSKE